MREGVRDMETYKLIIAALCTALAVGGGILSIVLGCRKWRRGQPKVKVTLRESNAAGRGLAIAGPVIEVTAVVPAGYPSVKCLTTSVTLHRFKRGFPGIYEIDAISSDPKAAEMGILDPGRRFVVFVPHERLASTLAQDGHAGKVKIVGLFVDEEGHEYRSRPHPFDIDEHRKTDD